MIDGISKALNTTFEDSTKQEIRTIDKELKTIEIKTEELKNKRIILEDSDLIKEEFLEHINAMKCVRKILELEMSKPPTPRASDVEAYSSLCAQIKETIREWKHISDTKANLELNQKRLENSYEIKTGNVTQNVQNNIFLTSSELDKMLENAQKERRIDQITVDFEIDSQIK